MPQATALGTFDLSADFVTPPYDITGMIPGAASIQCEYDGADAADGDFVIEATNELGGKYGVVQHEEALTDSGEGTYNFVFVVQIQNYVRVRYTANSVTAGTATIRFKAQTQRNT